MRTDIAIYRANRKDNGKEVCGYYLCLHDQQPDGNDLHIIVDKDSGEYNSIDIDTLSLEDGKIKSAMEKQIAHKPRLEYDGYANGNPVFDYGECPGCGHGIEEVDFGNTPNYCPQCGQALDWSDLDE